MGNETNDSSAASTRRRLATAAAFLVVATAGSRVLGLVREIVMSAYLGLGTDMGIFTVANKVPSLVRTLLADTALSAAFIPVFSGLLEKERRRDAWQVAFTVTTFATVALGLITILGMVFAPQVVKLITIGKDFEDPEIIAHTAYLMRVMFPQVVILGIAGILMGILNSYNHFTLPALAPIVWNLVIIGVLVTFERYGVKALAWGVVLGTVVELIIQVPAVWRRRWRPRATDAEAATTALGAVTAASPTTVAAQPSPWRLALRSPEVRRVGALLMPVIISLGIINFNSLIGTIVATDIQTGVPGQAPGIIERAFRLFQLPQGVFAIAIGTVLFPALSRHAAAKRMAEFRDDLSLGLRQIFFVTLPFAALFAVLALPTARLIYEHRNVTPDQTELVASALLFFSAGMAFVSVNTLLNRAFYGIQKPKVPLIMGVVNLVVNTGLMLALYKPMGVGGVTLSISLVSLINFFGLMVLLSPRIGGVDARRVAWSAVRSIIALVPLAAVSYWVWYGLDALLGRRLWAEIVAVLVAYAAGGAVYCLAAWAMRMSELRDVVGVIRRQRGPRSADEVIDLDGGS